MLIMKLKKQYVLVLALLVLTAALAAVHLTTRESIPKNAVRVTWNDETVYLDSADFNGEDVHGTLVNGKGEETAVNGNGLSLAQALEKAQVDVSAVETVTVTARDEFSAHVSGEELREAGKVYLLNEEEGVMLVVFGDSNAKRRVHLVERIDVQ